MMNKAQTSIVLTRPGKNQLVLTNPVMPAAGTFGYGNVYRDMVNFTKLGAIVTNPVTYHPRKPAGGAHIVPLDAGVLVHTGLPNPGASKVVKRWRDMWTMLTTPIILHLTATTPHDVSRSMAIIDQVDAIAAVELGLPDDIPWQQATDLTRAAASAEKPVLVRLPLTDVYETAEATVEAGAGALVVAAPPRGTARDPHTGQLVTGRVYSPTVKPMVLHLVERLAKRYEDAGVPVIGAGGIHTPQDARDYMMAGARAVQVDSVMWVLPRTIEIIARDLGGLVLTRESGALADEWFTGIGQTDMLLNRRDPYDDEDGA